MAQTKSTPHTSKKTASILKFRIKRSIALISDMHTGSTVALWPEVLRWKDSDTGEERDIKASQGQLLLLEYWHDFLKHCQSAGCDTVLNFAENIEGLNRKEFGGGLMVSSLNAQIEANLQLLTPLVRGKYYYQFSGSGYHDSLDYKTHRAIARHMTPIAKSVKYLQS